MKLFVFALMAVFAFSGCEKLAEKAVEKTIENALQKGTKEKVDVDLAGGGVKMKGKDGGEVQIGGGAKLPTDFPKDIPSYPEANIVASTTNHGGHFVIMATKDKEDKVMSFYSEKLSVAGWESGQATDLGLLKSQSFKKGELAANITVANDPDSGETQITITTEGMK